MPIYEVRCNFCETEREIIAKVDEQVRCEKCGNFLTRLMPSKHGISMGAAGAFGYYDEHLGKYIHTNRQRREEMKRQNVTEKYGKGWY